MLVKSCVMLSFIFHGCHSEIYIQDVRSVIISSVPQIDNKIATSKLRQLYLRNLTVTFSLYLGLSGNKWTRKFALCIYIPTRVFY
jgi:hypothetical protein